MRKYFLLFLFFPIFTNAQDISTFAGGGTTIGDGGPATVAILADPGEIIFDKEGNLYIACGTMSRVRKIDTFGIITTIAGTGIAGYSGDGNVATLAQLNFPDGVAIDTAGNIFIADAFAFVIRKIDKATGLITTVGGNGTQGNIGDGGPATTAELYGPNSIGFDKKGNLYIGDAGGARVRKINPAGIISTFAGTGMQGYNGDGIPATSAQLNNPVDVQADEAGNIYVSDQGNNRIRKVNAAGIIFTYAGNGYATYSGDGLASTNAQLVPTCLKFDSYSNLYVSGNNRVSVIDQSGIFHTIAGNGMAMNTGDGGPATAASIYEPIGIAFDMCSNLYITLINYNRIRKVTFNTPPCTYLEVNNFKEEQPINIYPNPSYDQLNINNLKTPSIYRLLNIIGAIMQQGTLKEGNNSISLQALPDGMYLLEITDEQKNRTVTKIVKQ